MTRKFRFGAILLCTLLILLNAQALAQTLPPLAKAPARVTIKPLTATVKAGARIRLNASVGSVKNAPVEWSVARGEDVGEVDEYGFVTGLKPGDVYVQATDPISGQSALRKVKVKSVKVTGVSLGTTSIVLDPGEVFEMPAPVVRPANATVTAIKWKSDKPSVATVDEMGRITAVSTGKARIQCVVGSKSASCSVRVRGKSAVFTLSAAGDVILGGDPEPKSALNRSTEEVFKSLLAQHGSDYPFKNVASVFRASDISIVNLEGTLTTQQTPRVKGKAHSFRGDPSYARILKNAGINACNLANNHTMDFKKQGLLDTQRSLNSEGIKWCDGKTDGILRLEKNGVTVRVGLAGFQTPVPNETIQKRIKALSKKSDIVVASFHWCDTQEWVRKNYASDRARAQLAIRAGADLVLGSHRHLPAGIETYRDRYIVYDLSNFVVGIKHKAESDGLPMTDSMIFQWEFLVDTTGHVEQKGIKVIPCTTTTSTEIYPATDDFGNLGAPVNNFQPAILTGQAGEAVLSRIRALSTVPVG